MESSACPRAQPSVSVVIPTIGRDHLSRAVEGAINQTLEPSEILVVVDHRYTDRSLPGDLPDDARIQVLTKTGAKGGAACRNVGVVAATGDFIAFLDDDDYWLPEKLERQVEVARTRLDAGDTSLLVTCPVMFHQSDGSSRILPRDPLPQREVGNYLVQRKHLRHGDGYVQSSTLMLDRATARALQWREDLPKHQDWDLVIRVALAGVPIVTTGRSPLVHVAQGTDGSISATANWRGSYSFLRIHPSLTGRPRADFVVTQIVAPALAEGDLNGMMLGLRALRAAPHYGAWAVALRGLLRRVRGADD